MERLTKKHSDGTYFQPVYCNENSDCKEHPYITTQMIVSKLAAYEDTGLTPEEISNDIRVFTDMWKEKLDAVKAELKYYKDAEEQGLLIKLPCKVGDAVYILYRDSISKGMCHTIELTINLSDGNPIYFITSIVRARIVHVTLGKTVFLTREAAEEALKGSASE